MSVKRKRMSFRRIPSSSSDDGIAAPPTESDLSDSVSADSHSQSAGEEEPPTKRKRDKTLKTTAERNRKSSRMKAAALALLPTSSTVVKAQRETALVPDVAKESKDESADKLSTNKCIPVTECDSVAKGSAETEQNEQHLDRPPSTENAHVQNEDSQVGAVTEESENATDKTGKTADRESVSSVQRDSGAEVDDAEVAVKKNCSESDCISKNGLTASNESDESCEKECTGNKRSSCSDLATGDTSQSVHENANGEINGGVTNDTEVIDNCTEDQRSNDEQAGNTKSCEKKDDGCKNRDEKHCNNVAEVVTLSDASQDEDKLDAKAPDTLASNGYPDFNVKKKRGRPKKSNKKGRKKREYSNVTSATSVTEVQETDYEPTKKLGRPSKTSRVAQLAVEGCDSLTQSEDDIPLIELRRSARSNKGQRKLDQLVFEQPKKRNRAKDEEKERKRAEKEENRRKREAELQEQAALKAKKVRHIWL